MLGDLTSAVSSALYTPWYCTLVQHRPPRAQAAIPHTPTSTHTKWGINPPLRATALPTPQLSAGRMAYLQVPRAEGEKLCVVFMELPATHQRHLVRPLQAFRRR